MISLPSTTKVGQKIPKERFYEHLKPTSKQRESFVRFIDSITIVNSIKPATMHIEDGKQVHEIIVLELSLKEQCIPKTAIEMIARTNHHKILFRLIWDESEAFAVYRSGESWHTDWIDKENDTLTIGATDLDTIWEALCSQVVFGSADVADVDSEVQKKRRLKALDEEIAKLERKHGKEKQIAKRNALYEELQKAKREREIVLEG